MAFTLPSLSYSFDAMEPYIDAQTMEIHYTKHHQGYIDKLNAALKDYPDLQNQSIDELLKNLVTLPEAVRTAVCNQGGGHANHSFFWTIMKKNGGGVPKGALAEHIKKQFGSIDAFKEKFNANAQQVFGSGWSWLSLAQDGKLVAHTTSNQDSPILQGLSPLIGLDVWEHAYYLKYQNRRPDYIGAWWHVIDWDRVEEVYRLQGV